MVSIERLDERSLRELSQRTDDLGVLSVYVHADPRQDQYLQAAAIDLRNRYRELQSRVAERPRSHHSRAVLAALDRLWPLAEDLLDPTASGRGRMVFAALGSDWSMRLHSLMPVPARVVLDTGPFIHPLLEMLDEGRPAGVVLVTAEDARLLEWRLGSVEMLSRLKREYIEAPHERAGPFGSVPTGMFHTPVNEQREARERTLVRRFLDQVAKVAAQLTGERAWERILVSGGERWTEPTIERLPWTVREKVVADTRLLSGLDDTELAEAVTEWARTQHKEGEKQLLDHAREAGLAGSGALGLSEVTIALNMGQVAHLIYDPEVRYTGSVGSDGMLYGGDEAGPDDVALTPEPRLTERLVEQALRTGARITPVEGAAKGGLKEAGGIAALLRW